MKRFVFRSVGVPPGLELLGRHTLHIVPSGAILALLRGWRVEIGGQVDEEVVVKIHVTIDLKFLMSGRWRVVFPAIEQRGGFRNLDIVIKIQVPEGGHPISVRRFVLAHQHERLFIVTIVF